MRKGNKNLNDCGFFIRPLRPEAVEQHWKVQKEKNCQPRILYPEKTSFKNEGEIKTLSEERKPRELIKQAYFKWRIFFGGGRGCKKENDSRGKPGTSEMKEKQQKL